MTIGMIYYCCFMTVWYIATARLQIYMTVTRRRNYMTFVNCAEPDEMSLSCRIWKPENDVAEERAEFTVTRRNMERAPTTKLEIIKQSIVISAMKIWIAKITDNCISKCHRSGQRAE